MHAAGGWGPVAGGRAELVTAAGADSWPPPQALPAVAIAPYRVSVAQSALSLSRHLPEIFHRRYNASLIWLCGAQRRQAVSSRAREQ